MSITIEKTAKDAWSAVSCSVTFSLKITLGPNLYAYNAHSAVSDSCTFGNLGWKVQCSVYNSQITLTLIASGVNAQTGAIAMPAQVKFSNQDRSHNTASLSGGQVQLGTWPTTVFADEFLIIVTIPRKTVAMKMLTEFIQDSFLTGGDLIDTKFYAFTRLNGRTADTPKAIYANSKFLLAWSSEYFTDLLTCTSEITDTGIMELSTHSPPQLSYDKYDYESDSDMDPFEDRDESEGKDVEVASDSKDILESSIPQSRLRGRVITITGTTFRTWKALIVYLYTGKITFAPLRSESKERDRLMDATACSPKSMYRLADECGFDDLKMLALEEIKARINAKNIVEEIYSQFTAQYPEIQQFQINYLTKNINSVKHELLAKIVSTRSLVPRRISRKPFSSGQVSEKSRGKKGKGKKKASDEQQKVAV